MSSTGDVPIEPSDPFPGMGTPELIAEDLGFGEGPVWSAPRQTLFFTDVYGDVILAYDGGQVRVHIENSGGADGLALDPEDRILGAQISAHAVARENGDSLETIASMWRGVSLNAPNDVTARADGTIFFTDPTNTGHQPQGFAGVYRIDPDGTMAMIDDSFGFPNGILLSTDGAALYVADSSAAEVWTFDVAADGSTTNKRLFAPVGDEPDGLSMDAAGSLYVTNRVGFEAYAPDGTRWGALELPGDSFVSNLTFGGASGEFLFVTTASELWRIPVKVRGPV